MGKQMVRSFLAPLRAITVTKNQENAPMKEMRNERKQQIRELRAPSEGEPTVCYISNSVDIDANNNRISSADTRNLSIETRRETNKYKREVGNLKSITREPSERGQSP